MTMVMTQLLADAYMARDYLFFLLNLGIIAGYMALVLTMLFPHVIMPPLVVFLSRKSRIAVAIFFIVASLTRAELAFQSVTPTTYSFANILTDATLTITCRTGIPNYGLVLHSIQLISIWTMLVLVSHDLLTRFRVVGPEK